MSDSFAGAAGSPPTAVALATFVDHYLKSWPELLAPFDPAWRSPAELGEPLSGEPALVRWRPVARAQADDFAGLERALETRIHPDLRAYYGAFWSGHLEAEAPDGHVTLLLLWNEDDVDRLTENLIGHALAQRRKRGPLSLFFACTEPDSDLILTLRNDTGEVLLERPGARPLRTVAPDLATFIARLVPAPPVVQRPPAAE